MNTKTEELYTWEQIVKAAVGTIFMDRFDEGVRFMIMRGPSSLCAYVGIPLDHPLAGFDYDDLSIDCHCGLTYSEKGCGSFPEGYWWYGWDYTHAGDYSTYYDLQPLAGLSHKDSTKGLVKMVDDDSWTSIYNFKSLMKLAEKISKKAKP